MPTFVLHCLDKADSLPLRMATRERHLAYVGSRTDDIKIAGPMLNAAGEMAGSMFILDVADEAAARAFSDADPYTQAGLWERVALNPVKITFGSV